MMLGVNGKKAFFFQDPVKFRKQFFSFFQIMKDVISENHVNRFIGKIDLQFTRGPFHFDVCKLIFFRLLPKSL